MKLPELLFGVVSPRTFRVYDCLGFALLSISIFIRQDQLCYEFPLHEFVGGHSKSTSGGRWSGLERSLNCGGVSVVQPRSDNELQRIRGDLPFYF